MDSSTTIPIPIPSPPASSNWISVAKAAGGCINTVAIFLSTVALRAAGYLLVVTTWLLSNIYRFSACIVVQVLEVLRVVFSPVTFTLPYAFMPLKAAVIFVGRLRVCICPEMYGHLNTVC